VVNLTPAKVHGLRMVKKQVLLFGLGCLGVLALPLSAGAAGGKPLVELRPWSVAPFVLLLLSIALLPLVAGHWWHSNRNRAIVAAIFAVPVASYLIYLQVAHGQRTLALLGHELVDYLSFILLLGSLYTVSGGIVVSGDLRPVPLTNTSVLAFGSLLANLIGTTGASVLLIRPLLRINRPRSNTAHLPIFFIFAVSNLGGLLTPLGDPPLFLGFLNGVPFTWTLSLWPQWLLVNGAVLAIFFIWDTVAYGREAAQDLAQEKSTPQPLRLQGLFNVALLIGIMAAVLLQGWLASPWGEIGGGLLMLAMGVLSLVFTPRKLREANAFTWEPILEVAILFAGIFVTMVPALEMLGSRGQQLGVSKPWEFFWLTGLLSGFLDNAPTYLTFGTMAAGSTDFDRLVSNQVPDLNGPLILEAISCGAVFMGALTYIGNGPNFMVKAIAEEAGYRMPAFFGYLAYSSLILLPVLVLVTFVFFL
jgi:Na+/H+ antiporter NhaD/arsenite permease-like protein